VIRPVVELCTLERLDAAGLLLRGGDGLPELLPFSSVRVVALGGITGAPRPYLILDLVLKGEAGPPPRVARMLSSQLDPRSLVGRDDLTGVDAFRELVRGIAASAGVAVLPSTAPLSGGPLPTFRSVEEYEERVLAAVR
jgi:hypothetical protein